MESEKKPKKATVTLGVIVVLLVAGFILWKYNNRPPQQDEVSTLGSTISNEVKAPGDAVPDVNPYKANTNPFEKANPYSSVYKNPFEK